jgi:hypothetical protein
MQAKNVTHWQMKASIHVTKRWVGWWVCSTLQQTNKQNWNLEFVPKKKKKNQKTFSLNHILLFITSKLFNIFF